MDFYQVPIGFGMALARNPQALNAYSAMTEEQKQAILNKIKEYHTISLFRHVRNDGDCVGASKGLKAILKLTWPEKEIYLIDTETAKYLEFLEAKIKEETAAILNSDDYKASVAAIPETEEFKKEYDKLEKAKKAEAEKEAAILRADGEAQAIRTVQQAMADSMAMLNEKAPNEQVIKLKSIEAMQKVADGKATKIIIPSEMQGLVGMANGIVEGVKE